MASLPTDERLAGFDEVDLGLTEAQARAEASRCLECGCSKQNHCALRTEATAHQVVFAAPLHVRPYTPVVEDHPFIVRDNNKSISCGLCIAACAEVEGVGVLAYQFSKGRLTVGTHNGAPLGLTDCISCGQCVRVDGPRGSVTVRIVDQCPECASGELDLSAQAFAKVADPAAGRVNARWQPVSCVVQGPIESAVRSDSVPRSTAVRPVR